MVLLERDCKSVRFIRIFYHANTSLESGQVPEDRRVAYITTELKKGFREKKWGIINVLT